MLLLSGRCSDFFPTTAGSSHPVAGWPICSGQSRTQPKKEVPKKQELKGFADEAYAECFPEFHHMGAEVALRCFPISPVQTPGWC